MPTKDGKKVIVYDVDDVLNDLNSVVTRELGLEISKQYRFKIVENTKTLTPDQMQAIIEAYGNPEIFKKTRLMPGADTICNIEKTGLAEVRIRSSNVNADIGTIKISKLIPAIPGLTLDKITMFYGINSIKTIDGEADIVIEDSIENLFRYSSRVTKILLDAGYNQAHNYGTTDEAHGITRVTGLLDAIDIVEQLVLA